MKQLHYIANVYSGESIKQVQRKIIGITEIKTSETREVAYT